MHIAFLTPEYPHSSLSRAAGIGTSIKNVSKGLVENNIAVTVFVINQSDHFEFNDNGVTIVAIKNKKAKLFNWYFNRKHINTIVEAHITKTNIQLIEVPDWTGITAFMKFSIPVVMRIHGSDTYFCNLEQRQQKLKNFVLEKMAFNAADKVIAVSCFAATQTAKVFKSKRTIDVIHNGIDITQFKVEEKAYEPLQLLYFGSVIRKKGVLELAHIFNELIQLEPKAKLMIVGNDCIDVVENVSTVQLVKDILNEEALNQTEFKSQVPYVEIKDLINKAHVVALPSYAEAFPMTWLETMALGKPLVASNIGWSKEIINDGINGYSVFPSEHKHYAEKIRSLFLDEKMCYTFGSNARETITTNFSLAIITKKNIEAYKAIINNE
jgi:glycosyltransferase involved in cell wall biosynthesis